jgi:hypothetical protein
MSDKKKPDLSLAGKARKFGVSLGTLKKVYKRGVAAWNSGHRPGTTPQQWGHARVNSFLRKGKTYHTADKDLREGTEQLNELKKETMQSYLEKRPSVKIKDVTPNISESIPKPKYDEWPEPEKKDDEIKTIKQLYNKDGKIVDDAGNEYEQVEVKLPFSTKREIQYVPKQKSEPKSEPKPDKPPKKPYIPGPNERLAEAVDINQLFERLIFTGADETQVKSARQMQSTGAKKEDIWKKTGAFQHPQTGRWLQEPISDDKMELPGYKQQGPLSDLGVGKQRQQQNWNSAANVVKHDQLFKKFPGLSGLPTVARSLTPGQALSTSQRGKFSRWGGRKSGGIQVMSPTESGAKDAMVHELQHAVQYMQGRDGGASPEQFKKQGSGDFMSKMKYYADPGENEARAAAARRTLTPQQRKERYPGKDFGIANIFEDEQLDEMQLVGTDEYRQHAIAMTPGQDQEIEDVFPPEAYGNSVPQTTSESEPSETSEGNESTGSEVNGNDGVSFKQLRKNLKEEPQVEEDESEEEIEDEEELEDDGVEDGVDFTPSLKTRKIKNVTGNQYAGDSVSGFPVLGLSEAVDYHHQNNLSLIENVYRPGSEMFFAMILEAKRLYAEGLYTPKDEYEQDLLESDIGEVAEFEGEQVLLDYPYEEDMEECWKGYTQKGMKKKGDKMVPNCVPMEEENDPTKGKGIGKPFRSRGGGAVYVRNEKGNVIKVNFSQSGMKKRFNEPSRVKSFVARHNCYGNKDKTSASYWACRWPRYFSDSGQKWW